MDRPDGTRCANCGAALTGLYCHACGQKHEPHVHSIGHFLEETTESLTHADSRLWRTVLLLLARPGFLTAEFFAGRRARYLPPIRLYLVVSVVFFLTAGALPDGLAPVRINVGDGATTSTSQQDCDGLLVELPGKAWLRPRLVATCERLVREGPAVLVDAFVHNLPRALFLFLPLVAALMLLLYWRPRRYYVEHLLFLVHNHAAVFLSATVLMLVVAVWPGSSVLALMAMAYYAWYFYAALRSYYAEGRGRTVAKYGVIALTYLLLGSVMLVATALYSAVTL
jgi:hypothetical protein